MALSHRPDFEALEKETEDERYRKTKYRDAYMWPYINEENLVKPQSLIWFMFTRGRCHPSKLAVQDHEDYAIGMNSLAFAETTLLNHRMDLTGQGSDDHYGRLVTPTTDPDMYATLEDRFCADPYYGLMFLEVQERILSFLVKCAKLILHDYDNDTLQQLPSQPYPATSCKTDTSFTSLATVAAETPYRELAKLGFDRIATLLARKRDDLADHLWLPREDPSYFEAQLRECIAHRPEMTEDIIGQQHPILNTGKEDIVWGRVLSEKIIHSYSQFESYSELAAQAEFLRDMQRSGAIDVSQGSELPEQCMDAMVKLRTFLRKGFTFTFMLLESTFMPSPPMQSYFIRLPATSVMSQGRAFTPTKTFLEDPTRVRIYWLFKRIWDNDELRTLLGFTNIIDELQRLMDSEDPEKATISPYLASTFSDLAVSSECYRQLNFYWSCMHLEGLSSKDETPPA